MTTDQIKNQITAYVRKFKENSGMFKSFEIISDYVDFLESEPYLKELLTPIISYINKQIDIIEDFAINNPEQAKKMDNVTFDPNNPTDMSLPVFTKEMETWKKAIDNKENLSPITGLSIYLMCLIVITNSFEEIKEAQKAGDKKRVDELIEIAKQESFSLISMPIKDNKPVVFTSSQYMAMCMEMVSKYIIDAIDSQVFLSSDKPQEAISFDKDKSILYIRGQAIKITLKSSKPLDHYILEALFSKGDLTEQADFSEISEDFLGNEYNGQNDWHKFRHACDRLNAKVDNSTKGQIKDFIECHTGKTGWCKINPKYL